VLLQVLAEVLNQRPAIVISRSHPHL